MPWHSYQISILVHITYRPNPNWDLNDEDSYLITEYQFYITDNHKHNSYFVQHCLQKHWIYMVDRGYAPSTHFVWSIGYVGQFKSHKPWYFVGCYLNLTCGCEKLVLFWDWSWD